MLTGLEMTATEAALLTWRIDPSLMMADCGLSADDWQREILLSDSNRSS